MISASSEGRSVPSCSSMRRSFALTAVAASSAWAVGSTSTGGSVKTLILQWNGTVWKQVPSPTPAGGAVLSGVAAVSAGSAWAVGNTGGASSKTLILRWNGTAWAQVPSPSPEAPSPEA